MFRTRIFCAALFCVLWMLVAFTSNAFTQGFPYAAPKAPEFDSQGGVVQKGVQPKVVTSPPTITPRGPTRSASQPVTVLNGSGVPAAPKAPVVAPTNSRNTHTVQRRRPPRAPVQRASAPKGPTYRNAAPAKRRINVRPVSTAPGQAPGQVPGQQQFVKDCSHFVQLIARAPNETVMRLKAREFLTCLLQTGWSMDRARKHVIATIQSTYEVMHQ
jgi:hypothetical protein